MRKCNGIYFSVMFTSRVERVDIWFLHVEKDPNAIIRDLVIQSIWDSVMISFFPPSPHLFQFYVSQQRRGETCYILTVILQKMTNSKIPLFQSMNSRWCNWLLFPSISAFISVLCFLAEEWIKSWLPNWKRSKCNHSRFCFSNPSIRNGVMFYFFPPSPPLFQFYVSQQRRRLRNSRGSWRKCTKWQHLMGLFVPIFAIFLARLCLQFSSAGPSSTCHKLVS